MKIYHRHSKIFLGLTLISNFLFLDVVFAAPKDLKPVDNKCKSYLAVDFNSGEVLKELNADEPLPPASMTKLMSAYVIFEAIQNGQVALNNTILVDARASKVGGSQVFLKQGETFTLDELLKALLVQSANDSAIALAQFVGGSVESFVERMNKSAADLGMKNSEFHTPHGLPPESGQKPDFVSARDFIILAQNLSKKYPQIFEYTSIKDAGFRDETFKMSNHNHLLNTFAGCDGFKTGFYNEAGFGVVATAVRDLNRALVVVMGCPQRKLRDNTAAGLMSEIFANYKFVNIAKKGQPIGDKMSITGGTPNLISPVFAEDLKLSSRIGKEIKTAFIIKDGLKLPINPGDEIGIADFLVDGRKIGSVKVVSNDQILPKSFLGRLKDNF